jgi:hypothetical protein
VYPGTAYLARYLRRRHRLVGQGDLSVQTLLRLFCARGLTRLFAAAERCKDRLSRANRRTYDLRARYVGTIDTVIAFLQGRDATLAYRLVQKDFLPRGENFTFNEGFDWYDGNGSTLALHDRAKFMGTLYLYDLAALVREAVFPYFQITLVDRFYDDFVHFCATFDRMQFELERPHNLIDELMYEVLDELLVQQQPDVVGLSVPFARNLYYALRVGKRVKEWRASVKVVVGGGLFNTSMRHPNDPRLFQYIDYLTLDDGERPLLNIVELQEGLREEGQLKRTFYLTPSGAIAYSDGCSDNDAAHEEAGAPDYDGLPLDVYFSTLETVNINQRVRSDGWWNKLTMAHGCYWKKCSFCDIHLSYIGDFDPASAKNLVDKVEELIQQTGHTGFHFVDEALPPKVMREFAIEVLRRGLHITWHGMLRFDKIFTLEFCRLLAASGMVGAFGGLEVASNRLLTMMKKGTTVEQVAVVAKNFQEAGVRVHAYLMYGFPTQTAQETVDALEVVRQLFFYGLLTSASWAKFGVTPHSPIGRDPAEYKIKLLPVAPDAFIEQVLLHEDPANDHERFTKGLMQAMKFFGLGLHTDKLTEGWFDFEVPSVSIDRDLMGKVLAERERLLALPPAELRRDRRVLWLGEPPTVRPVAAPAKGTAEAPGEVPPPKETGETAGRAGEVEIVLHSMLSEQALRMPKALAEWLSGVLTQARPAAQGPLSIADAEASYVEDAPAAGKPVTTAFEVLASSPAFQILLAQGLQIGAEVRYTGGELSVKNLPLTGGPLRAELRIAQGASHTAIELPAKWAHWLLRTLPTLRETGQPLFAFSQAFSEGNAGAATLSPLAEIARAGHWPTLLRHGLLLL